MAARHGPPTKTFLPQRWPRPRRICRLPPHPSAGGARRGCESGPEPRARRPDRTPGYRARMAPMRRFASTSCSRHEVGPLAARRQLPGGWTHRFHSVSPRRLPHRHAALAQLRKFASSGTRTPPKRSARFARVTGMRRGPARSSARQLSRNTWTMTETYSICRETSDRSGADIQLRSLAATVAHRQPDTSRCPGALSIVRVRTQQPVSALRPGAALPAGHARSRLPARRLGAKDPDTWKQEQDAHRCHAPGGDPGRGAAQWPGRGVRLRIGRPQTAARQHLSGQGHARRAVAAGRLRRLRRQPPRLPGLQRNPSRLLPDPGRRPAGAAAGGGRGRG